MSTLTKYKNRYIFVFVTTRDLQSKLSQLRQLYFTIKYPLYNAWFPIEEMYENSLSNVNLNFEFILNLHFKKNRLLHFTNFMYPKEEKKS